MSIFSFIKEYQRKKRIKQRLSVLPSVARRHNDILVNVFNLLESNQNEACILSSKKWIDSFPILQRDIVHEKEKEAMSFNDLLKHCSTNYNKTKRE